MFFREGSAAPLIRLKYDANWGIGCPEDIRLAPTGAKNTSEEKQFFDSLVGDSGVSRHIIRKNFQLFITECNK